MSIHRGFGINFLKYRPLYFVFSSAIFLLFIGGLLYKKVNHGRTFIYSVDFTGGTQILLGFSKPVTSSQVTSSLEKHGLERAITREFSSSEILVRLADFSDDAEGLGVRIKSALEEDLSETTVEIKQVDSVGGGVGDSLWLKALQAILAGLIIMLLYTWWRFWSISFGAGVLISLFHDALVILTFFLIFEYEISLNVIGAILAILGYSINDTIVIFARIRENMYKLKGTSLYDIVNLSLNETLRRTLLTSVATMLVVLALLLFGGEALRTLSLALLIGIVFGTYSSIAIASPVMLALHKDK